MFGFFGAMPTLHKSKDVYFLIDLLRAAQNYINTEADKMAMHKEKLITNIQTCSTPPPPPLQHTQDAHFMYKEISAVDPR